MLLATARHRSREIQTIEDALGFFGEIQARTRPPLGRPLLFCYLRDIKGLSYNSYGKLGYADYCRHVAERFIKSRKLSEGVFDLKRGADDNLPTGEPDCWPGVIFGTVESVVERLYAYKHEFTSNPTIRALRRCFIEFDKDAEINDKACVYAYGRLHITSCERSYTSIRALADNEPDLINRFEMRNRFTN